jgi:hypothetical protein
MCFYETDLQDNKDKNLNCKHQHQHVVKSLSDKGEQQSIKYGIQVSDTNTYLPHYEFALDSFKTNIEILRIISDNYNDNLITSEMKNDAYNNVSISEIGQTRKWTRVFVEKVRQVANFVAKISWNY